MSAPNISLGFGQVLIINSASVVGLRSIGNKVQFGVVVAVNDLSDKISIGDSIIYEVDKITDSFIYGSTIYIIISEKNISTEPPAP